MRVVMGRQEERIKNKTKQEGFYKNEMYHDLSDVNVGHWSCDGKVSPGAGDSQRLACIRVPWRAC